MAALSLEVMGRIPKFRWAKVNVPPELQVRRHAIRADAAGTRDVRLERTSRRHILDSGRFGWLHDVLGSKLADLGRREPGFGENLFGMFA